MHELYELKDKLMDELKEYGAKSEMSAGDLEVVDKLTHTVKNLCKIIDDMEDGGYSERYPDMRYRGGSSYERMRGRSYKRDSRGRYASTADEVTDKLHELMETAPDEKTRTEIQKFITKLDQM